MKLSRGLLLLSILGACGGGGGGDGDDVVLEPDAADSDQPDGPPVVACHTDATFGAVTFGEVAAAKGCGDGSAACADPNDPDGVQGQGTLNTGEAVDLFQLELYKGYSVFQTQIVPGTYTIAGDELNYATCGVCPRIFSDCTTDTCQEQYYATGGTVTISQIEPNLIFEVSDLTFEEVTIADDFTSTPVPGGCLTGVTSASFDAPAPDGGGA